MLPFAGGRVSVCVCEMGVFVLKVKCVQFIYHLTWQVLLYSL